MVLKKCVICGKEFNAVKKTCTTCSVDCRKEQAKRQSKEYYAKNRDEIRAKDKMRRQKEKAERDIARIKAKQPTLSIDDILKVAEEYKTTYGKAELAIRQGKIKI